MRLQANRQVLCLERGHPHCSEIAPSDQLANLLAAGLQLGEDFFDCIWNRCLNRSRSLLGRLGAVHGRRRGYGCRCGLHACRSFTGAFFRCRGFRDNGRSRQRIFGECGEREVESVLGSIALELDLRGHLRRQGGRIDSCLQVRAAAGRREPEHCQLLRRPGRRVEVFLRHDTSFDLLDPVARERPRVVVVQVESKHARARMRTLQMMKVVRCHEELTAVLRVVIPVRAKRPLRDHRFTVGTRTAVDLVDVRAVGARPRQRHRHLDQLSTTNPARARLRFGNHRVNGAGPDRFQPHRREVHLANRTCARFRLDDVGMHRTGHRDRRQVRLGRRLATLCGERDRAEQSSEQKSRGQPRRDRTGLRAPEAGEA